MRRAAKCIDEYKEKRVLLETLPAGEAGPTIDPRLEAIVDRMFQRCFVDGEYTQAVGIALECRRLDRVRPLPRLAVIE